MSTFAFQATEATVEADDFAALEQRILRAVDLLKAEEAPASPPRTRLPSCSKGSISYPRKHRTLHPRSKPTKANAISCGPASNAFFASSTSSQSDFS